MRTREFSVDALVQPAQVRGGIGGRDDAQPPLRDVRDRDEPRDTRRVGREQPVRPAQHDRVAAVVRLRAVLRQLDDDPRLVLADEPNERPVAASQPGRGAS